ncbi:MAG: outer membrane protein assembly factor BamA [Candidatus Theseobacter exili]|nr:outer membrane protein assembly factor BamA [Candidatus Theseobacter exili]
MDICKKAVLWLLAVFLVMGAGFPISYSFADLEGTVVKDIQIQGNQTVSSNVILAKIKTKVGSPLKPRDLNEDIKRLYKLGFFSNISIDMEETYDGVILTILVAENPVVKEILVEGNHALKDKKLLKKVESAVGKILSESQVQKDREALLQYYREKGYYKAEVDYKISMDVAHGDAIVLFSVKENQRAKVKKISFIGNKSIKAKSLLKIMKTKKSTLFSSGKFNPYEFDKDTDRVREYFRMYGFLDVKVEDIKTELSDDGRKIFITITVDEGKRYYVGETSISGNETFPSVDIMKGVGLQTGKIFTPDSLRRAQSYIKRYYYAKGYIDVRVRVETYLDTSSEAMNIKFQITEGDISYVNEIRVEGNTKTRSVVIRRELKLEPGDICDGVRVQRSQERLLNLGFFQSVYIDIEPTEEVDKKDLVIEVEEGKTGELGFGVGFSSIDKLIGFVEITQKNFDWKNFPTFTGDGQKLRFRTQFGKERQDFILSWTEPWFLEKPLSFGFDLFRRQSEYLSDVYNEKRTGGDVRLGWRIAEFLRGDLMYKLEETEIYNVSEDASDEIKIEEGRNTVSSMTIGFTRDTRNHIFVPSRGMLNNVSAELAGGIFGADRDFYKLYSKNSLYIGLPLNLILRLSLQGGYVNNYGDSDRVPIFERYFLGGANTLRGFKYRDVGPKDEFGEPIGGRLMVVGSSEITFPIITKVRGAVFYDTGNVWREFDDFALDDLKSGAGFGVRLDLPIGPIRLDMGYPIKKDEFVDYNERFHFNVGYSF